MTRGWRRFRSRTLLAGLAGIFVAGAVVAAVANSGTGAVPGPGPHVGASLTSPLGGVGAKRPNIVFVLTDDLSSNLVRYMPHVQALEQSGMTFTNYTVDDSLCCPSRSSILTGRFPHNTGVFTNTGQDGGFHIFHRRGEELQTFGTALHQAGYRTALLGKYLNGYPVAGTVPPVGAAHYGSIGNWVPPGWDRWAVGGWGYAGFDYRLNVDHQVRGYGHGANDYMTSVLQGFGQDFVTSSARAHRPFFLELATFSPHYPYTPAIQDEQSFAGLRVPRVPSYGVHPDHAPPWLATVSQLSKRKVHILDRDFRRRVQAVQSIDRAIDALRRTLAETGQLRNTVFIFSSDNGYHMGEHGMGAGKLTAFDTDVNVPLVVAGPGIPAGSVNRDLVQNVDLAPTFENIAGAPVPAQLDGRSIVALLRGDPHVAWRSTALIEHHGLDFDPHDPDVQTRISGNPPSYAAIRTARFTYVRYVDGEHEYYDRTVDPNQLDNIYLRLSPRRVAALNAQLDALQACRGTQCWSAGRSVTTG